MLNLLNVGNNIVPQPVSSSTNVKLILFALRMHENAYRLQSPTGRIRNPGHQEDAWNCLLKSQSIFQSLKWLLCLKY